MILRKIELKDKNLLENMMQLYLHDISINFPIDFDSTTCKYYYDLDSYFEKNIAFFIENEKQEKLGFILIDLLSNTSFEISEMFILNNYKRQGIGEKAIKDIFKKYRGDWIVKAVPLSTVAEKFWNNVINNYTNGNYNIDHIGKYNRSIFKFNNKN
jgi:predicted acetyltransferase